VVQHEASPLDGKGNPIVWVYVYDPRFRPPWGPLLLAPQAQQNLAKTGAANSTEHAPVRFCSAEHAPVRFPTVAPFCCRTTPASTVQHGPVRFCSDSSTAHVRFYRSTKSTPPRALARQCRFTMLCTVL
jgi:hypothetical protein